MRRTTIVITALAAAVVGGLAQPAVSRAEEAATTPTALAEPEAADPEAAEPDVTEPDVVEIAEAALDGEPAAPGVAAPDPTLALTDLYAAYDDLSRAEQAEADRLLARPTNNDDRDPGGAKYPDGVPVRQLCGDHVCVRYIATTDNAPPSEDGDGDGDPDQVETTLAETESVWSRTTGTLGYRAPASDQGAGGTSKFDVYLANLGVLGYYGYCAPEQQVPGQPFRASGYCVLDDDYAEYSAPPPGALENGVLRATAAHELFHAVQFNYDVADDTWLMEGTATWMEERLADDVNDNRNYLELGQLQNTGVPLDRGAGYSIFGNWAFFERLSQTYGVDAVRRIWDRLDGSVGAPDEYSTQAIHRFLAARGSSLAGFYVGFASGNVVPAQAYSEGEFYRAAPAARRFVLSNGARTRGGSLTINHLSHRHVRYVPASGLAARTLLIEVDGPPKATVPRARVRVHRTDGTSVGAGIALGRAGNGSVSVAFQPGTVARVTLTLANASSRMSCWRGSVLACQGTPLDNGQVFRYTATARR